MFLHPHSLDKILANSVWILTALHLFHNICIFEEFVHSGRNVIRFHLARLFGDLLVEQIALEDCVGGGVENGNENCGDEITEQEDDCEGQPRFHIILAHGLEEEVRDERRRERDKELGQKHEDVGQAFNKGEFGSVFQDQDE